MWFDGENQYLNAEFIQNNTVVKGMITETQNMFQAYSFKMLSHLISKVC